MNATATAPAIRAWAAARRLPDAHLARWLALAEGDRAALLSIAERLRLRTGQFVAAFELLEEIALREHSTAREILVRGEIQRILDGAGSAPERARVLLEELRAIRMPRLRAESERLKREIAALGLPRGVAVMLPHELGSDELRIEIVARGGAELERLIDELGKCSAGLGRVAEMLAGGRDPG
jgi:hypothetical protein